ncbi:GNAT family N-acetyltransferase [Edaphocola flava]|uniref:GNAT family N-acetyltransferase n=1 Tax=Edaphocola flava TaxID=2499629 RepID=UPI00100C0A98|nr:GNAT family protein [Edaphocola flava]
MQITEMQNGISLEPLDTGHTAALWHCISEHKLYLQQWIDWVGHCRSEADVAAYIQQTQDEAYRQEGLTMVVRSGSATVGIVSLQHWNRDLNIAELGFWIVASEQGKGLMQQAIRQLLPFGFKDMRLQKVEVACAATNTRALRLLQYMGFSVEGVLRRAILSKGLLTDKIVMGLLKEEYR